MTTVLLALFGAKAVPAASVIKTLVVRAAAPAIRRRWAAAVAAIIFTAGMAGTVRAADTDLTGDQVLARASQAEGINNLNVPIHFDVHLLRPIGARSSVEGVATFVAPRTAALQITKVPWLIGIFFHGTYDIDVVPQTWGVRYIVNAMTTGTDNGAPIYVLQASPVPASAKIDRVIFHVAQHDFAPLSVEWDYHDGSSIQLAFVDQHVGNLILPQTGTITVSMPTYALDANVKYGTYTFNGSTK